MALEIIEISPEEIQRFHSLANPENRQTEQDAVVAPPNNASIQNLPLTGGNTARNDGDEIVEPQVDVADGDANDDAHHAGSALNGKCFTQRYGIGFIPASPSISRPLTPHFSQCSIDCQSTTKNYHWRHDLCCHHHNSLDPPNYYHVVPPWCLLMISTINQPTDN